MEDETISKSAVDSTFQGTCFKTLRFVQPKLGYQKDPIVGSIFVLLGPTIWGSQNANVVGWGKNSWVKKVGSMWPFTSFLNTPNAHYVWWVGIEGKVQHRNRDAEKRINTCPPVGHQWKNNIQPPNPNHHLSTPFKTWVVFSVKNQPLLHNPPSPNATTLRFKNHVVRSGTSFSSARFLPTSSLISTTKDCTDLCCKHCVFEAEEISNRSIYMQWFYEVHSNICKGFYRTVSSQNIYVYIYIFAYIHLR